MLGFVNRYLSLSDWRNWLSMVVILIQSIYESSEPLKPLVTLCYAQHLCLLEVVQFSCIRAFFLRHRKGRFELRSRMLLIECCRSLHGAFDYGDMQHACIR